MGKFQQLRAKALSLRGGIAVGGALVMAVGMAQATGTLAQDVEVREAKAGLATENFFPTPLVTNVSCNTHGSPIGSRRARVSWDPVDEATGYRLEILVWNANDPNTTIRQEYEVGSATTSVSNIRDSNREVLYARVRTLNGPAVSSGYATPPERISFKDYLTGRTECENTGHPTLLNQPWENQHDWDPDVIPFAAGPSPSIFGALFDGGADLLGELPEGDELTSLDEATVDVAPTTSEKTAASPSSTRSSEETAPSPSQSSPFTTAATSSGTTSARETVAESSTSVPATTSSPPQATSSATVPPSSVQSTPSSSPTPTATSTTAQVPVRAGVGDGPIAVGASQARLEEVDDQARLIVTRGGSDVCAAEVGGASRIESSDGLLTVTVSGRTKSVDLETCELT